MVDFNLLLQAKRITRQLDALNVPGEGELSWERIVRLVKHYSNSLDEVPSIEGQVVNPESPEIQLSEDQTLAWERLQAWVKTGDPYFVLRGYAGTGKTYLLQLMRTLPVDILFSAPTNKATKVLQRAVKHPAKTTYSTLGIKMAQDDDRLVLTFGKNPPYIPPQAILVVDECSMVGTELYEFIDKIQKKTHCKVLYVGDPAQLPPVGEARSQSWSATKQPSCRAFLKKVMRYDNELLVLATEIRQAIQDKTYDRYIESANNGEAGVFVYRQFDKHICKYDQPEDWANRKIIAWRNRTVSRYNDLLREHFGFTETFHPRDILLLAEPIEEKGVIIANTDDEVHVVSVQKDVRLVYDESGSVSIPVWRLEVTGDQDLTLCVPMQDQPLGRVLATKAATARNAPGAQKKAAWKDFWDTKHMFHTVRYGYALTAHRAQGSTYEEVFVDQQDITANSNQREAWRCLYVAATRASTNIFSY